MRTRTKAKLAGKTAQAMVEHPALRKAVFTAGPPVVKVRFGLARRRARRRALERAERIQEAARTVSELLATYGPQAAEVLGLVAEALGLTEPPKRQRRAPSIALGVTIGASAMYFLEPSQGAARRARVVGVLAGERSTPAQ